MAFWDGGLGDLQSAGIQVTDLERATINNGGPVVYLQPLLHPFDEYFGGGGSSGMTYPDGSEVLVPLRIEAVDPSTGYHAPWKSINQPVWKQTDDTFGTDWRIWPAYIGLADMGSMENVTGGMMMEYYWTEELRPYRFWSCAPIAAADDLAAVIRLENAAAQMLSDSCFLDLSWIAMHEASGEHSIEEACVGTGLARDPKWSEEEAAEARQTAWEYIEGYYSGREDAEADARTYCHLVEQNLMCWSWSDEETRKNLDDITLTPFTEYLAPDDDYAREFWARATVKRRVSKARITNAHYRSAPERRVFDFREGNIAS